MGIASGIGNATCSAERFPVTFIPPESEGFRVTREAADPLTDRIGEIVRVDVRRVKDAASSRPWWSGVIVVLIVVLFAIAGDAGIWLPYGWSPHQTITGLTLHGVVMVLIAAVYPRARAYPRLRPRIETRVTISDRKKDAETTSASGFTTPAGDHDENGGPALPRTSGQPAPTDRQYL